LSNRLLKEQEAQGALSRSPEKQCLTYSFAQNVMNYMPIIWIIHAKLIVFFK